MKEKNRLLLLNIMSVTAVVLTFYTLFLIPRVCILKTDGGFFTFVYTAAIGAAGFALSLTGVLSKKLAERIASGLAAAFLLLYKDNTEKKHMLLSVLLYLSSIIPVLVTFTVYIGSGVIRAGFEALVMLVIYLFAVRCGLNSAYTNMSNAFAMFAFLLFIIAYAVSMYGPDAAYLRVYVSLMAYYVLLAYLIIKNQQDIDVNIYSGKYVEKSILPRNMRKFNLKTVLVLYAVIVALINIRTIKWILQQILNWTVLFISFIVSLFKKNAALQPDKLYDNAKGAKSPFPIEFTPEHPLMIYLRDVITTFIMLYFAYWVLIFLYRVVFKKLIPRVIDYIRNFFKGKTDEDTAECRDYDDEVVIEKPESEGSKRRKAAAAVKKARSRLKDITDPAGRIRFMYAAAIELLQASGVRIIKSDTVGNISAKASAGLELADIRQPLGRLSIWYEKVRYGCRPPEENELLEAEDGYKEITGFLLKKR